MLTQISSRKFELRERKITNVKWGKWVGLLWGSDNIRGIKLQSFCTKIMKVYRSAVVMCDEVTLTPVCVCVRDNRT